MKKSTSGGLKTFWFDLGNVILFFDFTVAFERLAKHTHLPPAKIRRYFEIRRTLEADVDEGRMNASQLFRKIKRDLRLVGIDLASFKLIWNDIFMENMPVVKLLARLKKDGYRLILISNTNRLHYDYILKRYGVLRHFDHLILSFKERTRKPKRKIYHAALKVSRAKPHEIFYTDDREDLILAARANHGVHAHTFRSADGLFRELRRRGVRSVPAKDRR